MEFEKAAEETKSALSGRIVKEVESRRDQFIKQLDSLAGSLEKAGESDKFAKTGAGYLHKAAEKLQSYSPEDVFALVRRNPVALIAGGLAAGFLGARLVRG